MKRKCGNSRLMAVILAILMIVSLFMISGCNKKEANTNEQYDPYSYDSASPITYQSGVARVWQLVDGEYFYGFIDEAGKVIIPCIYENTHNSIYEDKYIVVKKDGKYGVLDVEGKELISCECDSVTIEEGKARVEKDGTYDEIDLELTAIDKHLEEIGEEIENIELD